MKIVFISEEVNPATEFENGHLYQRTDVSVTTCLYLYSCGKLIELPVCNRQFDTNQSGTVPKSFIDVTDNFELRQVN